MDDAATSLSEGGGVFSLGADVAFALDCGEQIHDLEIAYKTYGALNAARSNAVLVCHALTLDQHVASPQPATGKPGWWGSLVGPGRPLDPAKHFIVCANVIGGCSGSTGPGSIDPATGEPYGLTFPLITVADMVRAQALLVEALGVARLFAVVGGSMGGMQVLQWAADYPERLYAAVCIASAPTALGAEHRLPRGRPTGGDGRSGLARRRLRRSGRPAGEGLGRRPNGGAHHLSLRSRPAAEVRPASCSRAPCPGASTPTSRSKAICVTRG